MSRKIEEWIKDDRAPLSTLFQLYFKNRMPKQKQSFHKSQKIFCEGNGNYPQNQCVYPYEVCEFCFCLLRYTIITLSCNKVCHRLLEYLPFFRIITVAFTKDFLRLMEALLLFWHPVLKIQLK
jgi:hypothetical protein